MDEPNNIEIPFHLIQSLQSDGTLENLCRICFSSETMMLSLFSTVDEDNKLLIIDMLKELTLAEVHPVLNSPLNICTSCRSELVVSHNFRNKCLKAELILKSMTSFQQTSATINIEEPRSTIENVEVDCFTEDKSFFEEKSTILLENPNEGNYFYLLDLDNGENDNETLCIVQGLENKPDDKSEIEVSDSNALISELIKRNVVQEQVAIQEKQSNYTCNLCYKVFGNKEGLSLHNKHRHRARKASFPCANCKERFQTKNDLHLHSALHSSGAFICPSCSKEFRTKSFLKRHLHRHMDLKRFKCLTCEKSFSELYALKRHTRVHTGETVEKNHICGVCEKGFSTRALLGAHQVTHSGTRPFACACGKAFASARLLASHRLTHSDDKPFVCSVCGKTFIQACNLRLHMRTHTGEKPYCCSRCEKRFPSGSALKNHMRTHTQEKPYSCKICGQRSARPDFSAHMRTHTGERPFQCSVCSKKFTSASRLRDHCRIHTGEKPFECASCTLTFSTKAHLIKHVKVHQFDSQEKRDTATNIAKPIKTKNANEDTVVEKTTNNEINENYDMDIAHTPLEIDGEMILKDENVIIIETCQTQHADVYISAQNIGEITDLDNKDAIDIGDTVIDPTLDQKVQVANGNNKDMEKNIA